MCKKGIDLGVDSEGSVGAVVLAPSPPGLFERVLATGQYSSVPEHVHGICEALGSLHDHRRKEGNKGQCSACLLPASIGILRALPLVFQFLS